MRCPGIRRKSSQRFSMGQLTAPCFGFVETSSANLAVPRAVGFVDAGRLHTKPRLNQQPRPVQSQSGALASGTRSPRFEGQRQ